MLYAATDIVTALAETFQHRRTVNRRMDRPWLVSFGLSCELVLLDLTGTFPVSVGGSMKLVTGPALYAQNWSRGFYDAYPHDPGALLPRLPDESARGGAL